MGWLGTTVISWGGKIRSCSLSSHRHFVISIMLIIRRIDRVISRFYHDTLPFRMICWRRDLVSRWFHVPPHCHSSSSLLPSNSKHHHDHHHCTTGSSCLCFISIPTQHLRWRRAKPRVPALRRQSPPSSRARQPSAFQPPPPGSWSITPVLSCLSCFC